MSGIYMQTTLYPYHQYLSVIKLLEGDSFITRRPLTHETTLAQKVICKFAKARDRRLSAQPISTRKAQSRKKPTNQGSRKIQSHGDSKLSCSILNVVQLSFQFAIVYFSFLILHIFLNFRVLTVFGFFFRFSPFIFRFQLSAFDIWLFATRHPIGFWIPQVRQVRPRPLDWHLGRKTYNILQYLTYNILQFPFLIFWPIVFSI